MENFTRQVEEWKQEQAARLPKVALPCRYCRKESEVEFEAPAKCPYCGKQFLGKSIIPRLIQLVAVLFVLGFGYITIKTIATGGFTPKGGAHPNGSGFMQPGKEGMTILILVVAGSVFMLGNFFFQVLAGAGAGVIAPKKSRERWVRYENNSNITLEKSIWVHSRSLLAPYQKFSEWDLVNEHQRQVFWKYNGPGEERLREVPSEALLLLRDLLWVDAFLRCAVGGGVWDEEHIEESASDSPAVMDFARRIAPTEVSRTSSGRGTNLLQWVAEHSRKNAPRLSELLYNPETLNKASKVETARVGTASVGTASVGTASVETASVETARVEKDAFGNEFTFLKLR